MNDGDGFYARWPVIGAHMLLAFASAVALMFVTEHAGPEFVIGLCFGLMVGLAIWVLQEHWPVTHVAR